MVVSVTYCVSNNKGTYVVLVLLEPVERLFRTIRTIPWGCLHLAVRRVRSAATSDLGSCKGYIRRAPCDITPEAVHVV